MWDFLLLLTFYFVLGYSRLKMWWVSGEKRRNSAVRIKCDVFEVCLNLQLSPSVLSFSNNFSVRTQAVQVPSSMDLTDCTFVVKVTMFLGFPYFLWISSSIQSFDQPVVDPSGKNTCDIMFLHQEAHNFSCYSKSPTYKRVLLQERIH